MTARAVAVVLAGGAGTRFWPASRRARPKQLLPLVGGESLLRLTLARIAPRVPIDDVLVATGAHLAEATAAALPELPRENLLAEPAPRNTGPAIAWATWRIAKTEPDAVVCVFPSDHFVADEPAFHRALDAAIACAAAGRVVTLGVVPSRPETGFGYVERGGDLGGGAFAALRFVEKPDLATAERYLAAGTFSWNAGMFFFRASVMKDAVRRYLPELAAGLDRVLADERALAEVFPRLPSISIDYGVMEKAAAEQRVAIVPGDFGWNDLGSWQSAWELAERDAAGNALPPGAVAVGASRNLVVASGRPKTWALAYVEDLVIVETEDAVLVIPRSRAQEVRDVIAALEARGSRLL